MGAFQGPKDWGRLLTAMVTPFDTDGAVDYDEAQRIAAYLVDEQQNDGLVISGTTGESPTLTESEKLNLLRVTKEAVGDRAAVLFGAGSYDTAESMALARKAEAAGADGIMLVNPYYSRPGQAGLFAHFAAISQSIGLPVMLYNIQGRSAINLETPTLLRLAEISNIVAVKEASGLMSQISDVCAQAPTGFRVYSGDDALAQPIMAVGGYGLVSVAAHISGRDFKKIVTDWRNAVDTHQRLIPVIKAIFSAPSPVPVKYALSLRGFDCETVRLPLVPLTEDEKAVVQKGIPTPLAAVHR